LDDLKPTYWLILSAAECVVMGPWETVPIPQLFWMAWCVFVDLYSFRIRIRSYV